MSLDQWCRARLDPILADLSTLVASESPSSAKPLLDSTADLIRAWLDDRLGPPDEWRRHVQADHGDVLTATYRGTTEDQVLLIGHYDTVWPSGTLADMPFHVDGVKVTGPGVYDMKAGLVTGIWALRALRALDLPCPTVTFLLNGDEELGSPVSRPYIEQAAADSLAALVLEPGVGWDVKTERKGVGVFTLGAQGIEAHAGNDPEAGASAVHALARAVGHLVAAEDRAAGTTINVGTITGGTARNVIAGEAHGMVDIRVTTQTEADRVDQVLAGLSDPDLAAPDPRVRMSVTGGWNRPPMRLTPSSKRLFDLANDVATDIRGPLTPISVGGGSDANFVAALGVPVLDGLGASGAGAHARHEHVLVADMTDRVALVAGILTRLAG
ncbi:peptidase M20 [Actinosynnema sp. ALI-1.44]|uniref:M20 family metallopeptidase n=1 Tax=Actinosynnema sp. ALI-1.44 TaxID=1933779 RepID=UPI00097BE407|nr:M20 family metallopeptidase [Actinosynnema sp. ALI-1.44]ONI84275.1 peptidase M20 [Actinosynnema sp. ALI-1.44]